MGTTAEKFNYAFETKDLLKTEINKINNVLDDNSTFRSYPQELFNGYLDILNNGTDTLWNNLEKVSVSGEEATLENVETAPMKVELQGNTQQNGEPTPDTPIPVQVVTGENVVSVSGKNLFDVSTSVNGYINPNTGEVGGSTVTKTSDFIEANSNSTYSFSFDYDTISNTSYRTIAYYNSNKEIIGYNTYLVTNKEKTFETPNNTSYVRISYPTESYDIQLEEGIAKTDFVPYSKTNYPINLGDIELCKINTYKDFPFKAINGNEYYDSLTEEQKNALVYGKWYVHKSEVRVPLLSNYGWYNSGTYAFKYITSLEIVNPSNNNMVIDMFCNYFEKASTNALYNGEVDYGISISIGKGILIRNKDLSTSIADFKTYLDENNIYAYIPLATPTEEEITDTTLIEQLEAISNAKSVKDKTFITQTNDELPFILDVEAIKEYEVN